MIERGLYQIIAGGIEYLRTTPGAISGFFTADGLISKEEADQIETFFVNNWSARDPNKVGELPVVHGYGRMDSKFPLIAITLGGENESQVFLGDEGGMVDDPEDADFGADNFSAIFGYTFNLLIYAQTPDLALALYELLKQVIINGYLILKGDPFFLFDLKFSGADMAPDPAWVPAGMFLRRATLACSREYTQTIASTKLGKFHQVQSIHIDARGDIGGNVGGVRTHFYPVNPDGSQD